MAKDNKKSGENTEEKVEKKKEGGEMKGYSFGFVEIFKELGIAALVAKLMEKSGNRIVEECFGSEGFSDNSLFFKAVSGLSSDESRRLFQIMNLLISQEKIDFILVVALLEKQKPGDGVATLKNFLSCGDDDAILLAIRNCIINPPGKIMGFLAPLKVELLKLYETAKEENVLLSERTSRFAGWAKNFKNQQKNKFNREN